MSAVFSRIGLIGKPGDPRVGTALQRLIQDLLGWGLTVTIEQRTQNEWSLHNYPNCCLEQLGHSSDLVIVVGGDGTLLGAARALANQGTLLLGINLGRFGFLVDSSPANMQQTVARILDGQFEEERRYLLQAEIAAMPSNEAVMLALNDVVLHKWNTPRMVEFETVIDGQFVNTQRSDGLIVATPTGSTAYALSGGGPLLHPSLDALLLVSICPHTLSHRPLVVSGAAQIEIRLRSEDCAHTRVSCDGQPAQSIVPGQRLFIQRAAQPVRLLHPQGHDYYRILRAKLGWGGHLIG